MLVRLVPRAHVPERLSVFVLAAFSTRAVSRSYCFLPSACRVFEDGLHSGPIALSLCLCYLFSKVFRPQFSELLFWQRRGRTPCLQGCRSQPMSCPSDMTVDRSVVAALAFRSSDLDVNLSQIEFPFDMSCPYFSAISFVFNSRSPVWYSFRVCASRFARWNTLSVSRVLLRTS